MEPQSKELTYERLGEKKLTLIDVIAQSVGFIGPVFSSAFIIPLIIGLNPASRGAGSSAALSVLLAAIGIFALGWIVAQYARRIHAAGSLYDYVSNGLGKTIGAASGWLYYGGTIILTTGLGVLLGGYVKDTLLTTFEVELDIPVWVWDAVLALLLFVVLYFGVKISTRVQLTLALVSMAVVLIFFISVISQLGDANDVGKTFDPSPSPSGFTGILFGVLYGVLIFVGFETAANLAEETRDPKRAIPRAVLGAVFIVTIFYLVAAYTEVAGFGFDLGVIQSPEVAGTPSSPGPLLALGLGELGSELWFKVLVVVVFLDMLAVFVGAAVASTRGVFAMARDRRLPGFMAYVSRRYGTPAASIIFLIVVQVVLIVLSEGSRFQDLVALPDLPHYYALFAWCATFGGFALLVVYFLMALGALRGLSDHPKLVRVWIAGLVGIAATGSAIYGSFYKVPDPTILAPYAALIWAGAGLLYMLIVRGREPASRAIPELRTHQE